LDLTEPMNETKGKTQQQKVVASFSLSSLLGFALFAKEQFIYYNLLKL